MGRLGCQSKAPWLGRAFWGKASESLDLQIVRLDLCLSKKKSSLSLMKHVDIPDSSIIITLSTIRDTVGQSFGEISTGSVSESPGIFATRTTSSTETPCKVPKLSVAKEIRSCPYTFRLIASAHTACRMTGPTHLKMVALVTEYSNLPVTIPQDENVFRIIS